MGMFYFENKRRRQVLQQSLPYTVLKQHMDVTAGAMWAEWASEQPEEDSGALGSGACGLHTVRASCPSAPCLAECCAIPVSEFLIIEGQEAPHFHFALGSANYVARAASNRYVVRILAWLRLLLLPLTLSFQWPVFTQALLWFLPGKFRSHGLREPPPENCPGQSVN